MRVLPWLAKVGFAAFAVALLIGLVAAAGTRFGFWDYRFGLFALFPWCLYFGSAAFVIGLVWSVWAAVANRGEAARYGVIAFLGSIVLLAAPLYDIYLYKTSPMIHDISTDTEHPPQFVALLAVRNAGRADPHGISPPEYDGPKLADAPDGKSEPTWKLQKKYYPDLRTRADLTSPAQLFDRAERTARSMGWNVVAVDLKQGRIEATDTSFWFGMTDDIVIRVRPAGQGARLDIRSKSRVGESDFGENAARIRDFMKKLANTS
jgi:Protein of unknown function (DUF1499)